MMWSLIILPLVFVSLVASDCPHEDGTLVSWNTASAWQSGQVPSTDEDAVLIGNVLLDTQPETLHHLTIAAGGKLVFDPNTDVHVKVHAIYIDGELHIGSKDCLFTSHTRITFLGNVGEDKVLLVRPFGTLEVHGDRKLPWTKLSETALKLESTDGILEVQDLALCDDKCKRGLILYHVDPVDGSVIDARLFDFNVHSSEIVGRIEEFIDAIADIPDDHIIGIAMKAKILSSSNLDLSLVYSAIDILASDGVTPSQIHNVDVGSAFAMLTIKGQPDTTVQAFEANTGKTHMVSATAYYGSHVFVLDSSVTNQGMGCSSFVKLHAFLDEHYRPTITLLDEVDSWKIGDHLVLPSTDYNPDQAEEVTILEIVNNHQVRLEGPLVHTHFGEMYKGIDMRGEVGLLTRNVVIDAEDADDSTTYGGHIKVLHNFTSFHIEGAEITNLGQQEVLGAYSIHFHLCQDVDGDEETRPWVRQNSIHHSNSRCVTVHGTHGAIVEDNVCFGTIGHSYFLEDGGEKRTRLYGNLGCGTKKPVGPPLIPTDKACPTTFWVTNPMTYMANNVAAGSDCRGFWYNYPDLPTGPSRDMGFMAFKEARFTKIYEFYNNVAHSNKGVGLFIDNIVKENGESNGYNKYRPMKNPIENGCIDNPGDCEDDCVSINRLTAYKNAKQNTWIRGGCIEVVNSSLSDSSVGIVLIQDNPTHQSLRNSIVIGDSANKGEPESFLLPSDGVQRSFPFGTSSSMKGLLRAGVEFRKGPVFLYDVWFNDFSNNNIYKMGALAPRRNNKSKSSARSSVFGLLFGFNDPTEGNRVLDYHPDDEFFTNEDGDQIASIRDVGGSVSEPTTCETATIVRAEPFHMTDECHLRDNWNMAWCCQVFGMIRFRDSSAIADTMEVTMTRDDDENRQILSSFKDHALFLVLLGGQYSYSAFFNEEIPEKILIDTEAITESDNVRLGICLPPNADDFDLRMNQPTWLKDKTKWTKVDTLAELDSDTVGDKYFYHNESGYFATVLRHADDFVDGDFFRNPKNKAISLTITVVSGDRTNTRCLDAARQALGDLAPQQSTRRSLLSLLRRLLLKQRTVTSVGPVDQRTLYHDSRDPPQGFGASSTHVPRNMK